MGAIGTPLPPNFLGFVDEMPGMPEEFPAATA
jgi:hypothetical protein